jgi:hypothetical protein
MEGMKKDDPMSEMIRQSKDTMEWVKMKEMKMDHSK